MDPGTHKISVTYVMLALFLEFSLLMIMVIVTMFTPEDMATGEPHKHGDELPSDEIARIKREMAEIKSIAKEDIETFNEYVESINNVNRKLAQAKAEFFKSLSDLKQLFK